MGIISKILISSPYPELIVRKAYYTFIRGKVKRKKDATSREISESIAHVSADGLINHIRNLGIKEGDLLIVHSSAAALKTIDCSEVELLDYLIGLVGQTGTIALPAFPEESLLKEKENLKIYDPKRSVAWTGMLPNLMLRKKGAIRSCFPCNPLVAIGPMAEKMMEHNLHTEYAHDNKSCWGYCAENHAKVLFLGIPSYHSNTIIHTVEDYQPQFWPDNWYEEKEYFVNKAGELLRVKVKVRKVEWSKYLAERYTEQKYIQSNYIEKYNYEGIMISLINDSYELVNAIMSDWKKMRFYYLPQRLLHTESAMKRMS